MEKTKNNKLAIVAGLFIIISYCLHYGFDIIVFIIDVLIGLLFFISFLTRNRILLIVSFVLSSLESIGIAVFFYGRTSLILSAILWSFSVIGFIIIIIESAKNNKITNYSWFIPPLILIGAIVFRCVFLWNEMPVVYSRSVSEFIGDYSLTLIGYLFRVIGFILTGLCIKQSLFKPKLKEPKQLMIVDGENNQNVLRENSEANRIKQLKELLDAGVLTQKEFEEKKKQILNGDR